MGFAAGADKGVRPSMSGTVIFFPILFHPWRLLILSITA
jgi:hypothetical protein